MSGYYPGDMTDGDKIFDDVVNEKTCDNCYYYRSIDKVDNWFFCSRLEDCYRHADETCESWEEA